MFWQKCFTKNNHNFPHWLLRLADFSVQSFMWFCTTAQSKDCLYHICVNALVNLKPFFCSFSQFIYVSTNSVLLSLVHIYLDTH